MIKWTITHMDTVPSTQVDNLVVSVGWRCEAEQEIDGVTYGGLWQDNTSIATIPAAEFTPYEELKPDQVFAWFMSDEFRADIEARVMLQVLAKATVVVRRLGVPWGISAQSIEPEPILTVESNQGVAAA